MRVTFRWLPRLATGADSPARSYDGGRPWYGLCRITFNTRHKWSWARLATVMIHEYGHAKFGLKESRDLNSIMYCPHGLQRGSHWTWRAGGEPVWWSVPPQPYGCFVRPLPPDIIGAQDRDGCP